MVETQRIAFVTELYLPDMGGMQYRHLQLGAALARRGHEVSVWTTDYSREGLPPRETVGDVQVRRYVKVPGYRDLPGTRPLIPLLIYSAATRRVFPKISEASDVIVLNQMPIAHLPWIRALPNIHVDWCELTEGGIRGNVFTRSARRFGKGFAVSELVMEGLTQRNPQGRFSLLRTPLEVDAYSTGPKRPGRFLYVGRLVPHKNPMMVVEAIRALHDRGGSSLELDVAGDGPLLEPLRRAAQDLPYIRIHGAVGEDEKRRLYGEANVFLLPSEREGLPNAIAEAVVSGTPIVTTNARMNGSADFVRRHSVGVTMDKTTTGGLIEAIRQLEGPQWQTSRDNCLRLREEFRPQKACQVFETAIAPTLDAPILRT